MTHAWGIYDNKAPAPDRTILDHLKAEAKMGTENSNGVELWVMEAAGPAIETTLERHTGMPLIS